MTTGPPPSQVFRFTRHVELPAPRPSGSTHNDNDEDNGNDCHDISIIMAIVSIIIIGGVWGGREPPSAVKLNTCDAGVTDPYWNEWPAIYV